MSMDMDKEEKPITLTVLTPDGVYGSARCDSVRLCVPDSRDGRVRGGGVGIRRGHADALMTVAPGVILGLSDGEPVLKCRVRGGLAVVSDNTVSVLTDGAEEERAD